MGVSKNRENRVSKNRENRKCPKIEKTESENRKCPKIEKTESVQKWRKRECPETISYFNVKNMSM